MSEPGTGSDLAAIATRARRVDGDTTSSTARRRSSRTASTRTCVITAVRTDPNERHRGLSLLVVERGTPGFERGRNLEKIGMHAQDTAELFFDDARCRPRTCSARRARASAT